MPYPFPGMNPWLENRRLWKDVHARLITSIGDSLASALEPRYFVGVETHTYISTFPSAPPASRYPDVTILNTGGAAVAVQPSAATAMPIVVDLPLSDNIEEPYLEIQLLPSGEVVTVIELLSHTNTQGGRDRTSYLKKRQTFLDANVNFVEIDLLRSHEAMPHTEKAHGKDYRIFIRRREQMNQGWIYGFDVREAIPIFPLPLQSDDQEPSLNLGPLLQGVYDRARYRLIMDYSQPPVPRMDEEDEKWLDSLIHQSSN
ncbi:MAG: DUF4058 family protein [Chloroflexota bacterium]